MAVTAETPPKTTREAVSKRISVRFWISSVLPGIDFVLFIRADLEIRNDKT